MQQTKQLNNVTLQKGDDGYWLQFDSKNGPAGINLSATEGRSIAYRNIAAWAEEQLSAPKVNDNDSMIAALQPIAKAYPDDPGTSDLDDEQPVGITLGDVRRVWRALRDAEANQRAQN